MDLYSALLQAFFLISTGLSVTVYGTENKRLMLHDDASLAQAYQTLAAEVLMFAYDCANTVFTKIHRKYLHLEEFCDSYESVNHDKRHVSL